MNKQVQAAAWLASSELATAFSVPGSLNEWDIKRAQIRSQLWELLGRLPPRPRIPTVQVVRTARREGYLLEEFQYDNCAGATVSSYILLPLECRGKAPAVLFCHWHGGEYNIGKEELLQTKHCPEAPGPTLARRGYIVLGIDAYGFGQREGQGPGGPYEEGSDGELTAFKFNLWVGRTLWGMILRDDLMALDYLASRPEVDAERIGVTGISMGSTRSWWLMALDERIQCGVAVACLTRYRELIQHHALSAHGIYYFVPGFLNRFDTEAVVALIAPRPVLFQTGDQDVASPADGIRKIEAAVRSVYRLYGREQAFESLIYAGLGHVYTPEMWARTVAWLDAHLKG